MKKVILLYLFSAISYPVLFGQGVPKHDQYINDAILGIKSKKYLSSMNNLVKGREELNILLGKELEKALPKKSGEWEMSYSEEVAQNAVNNMAMNPNRFEMVRVYSKAGQPVKLSNAPQERADPLAVDSAVASTANAYLTLSISNCAEYFGALDRAYLADELPDDHPGKMMLRGAKPLKFNVQGNRAYSLYNNETQSGECLVNVGNGVVRITGTDISNADILKTIVEAINYKILKENLQ